jgi:hypothetical protein
MSPQWVDRHVGDAADRLHAGLDLRAIEVQFLAGGEFAADG